MMRLYWSSGSVSIDGLRLRTYTSVLPDSPAPGSTEITRVTKSVSVKSDGGPIGCQVHASCLKIGASAKPSAGSVNAAAAMPPAPCARRPS